MTEKNGAGQADKAAAERKTAQVAADNAKTADQNAADPATDDAGGALRVAGDQTPERTDDAPDRLEGVDAALSPYPQYEAAPVDDLKTQAEARGVEMNRDVEKAELIKALRGADTDPETQARNAADVAGAGNPYPSYDVMPLEELRKLAEARDVALPDALVKAHLITELRAADSGVNTGGGTTV